MKGGIVPYDVNNGCPACPKCGEPVREEEEKVYYCVWFEAR